MKTKRSTNDDDDLLIYMLKYEDLYANHHDHAKTKETEEKNVPQLGKR